MTRLTTPQDISLLLFVLLLAPCSLYGQDTADTARTFPFIKSYRWGAVYAVPGKTFKPDPGLQYKIVFDVTVGPKNVQDTAGFKEMNWGFGEVGRIINLHVADGIPLQNLELVVAVHGAALFSMMNHDAYRKKYGIENPSLVLVDELKEAGVRFVVCGQAMHYMNVAPVDLIPNAVVGLTAQTVLTSYQAKGYSLLSISPED